MTPFLAFSAAIRKIIHTTNAVESLNRVLRKTLKTKDSFPTEEAATKLISLAIRTFEKGGRAVRERQPDPGAPDMLSQGVAIRDQRLRPLPVRLAEDDGYLLAHTPDPHAPASKGASNQTSSVSVNPRGSGPPPGQEGTSSTSLEKRDPIAER